MDKESRIPGLYRGVVRLRPRSFQLDVKHESSFPTGARMFHFGKNAAQPPAVFVRVANKGDKSTQHTGIEVRPSRELPLEGSKVAD